MNQFLFRPLLFPLFVLCLKTAAAQPADSTAERLVEKADFFINNGMLDSAIQYGHALMDYAQQNKLPLYESSAWSLFSIVAYHQGNADEAIAQQDSALSIRQIYYGNKHPQVASSLSNIGAMILDLKSDPEAALIRLSKALDICNDCKTGKDTCTDNFLAALFNNIGNIQMERNNFEEAEKEYMKSYAIRSQFPNDPKYKLAHLLNNIGTLKLETGHTSSARDYLMSAQSLYMQWNKGEETPDLIQVLMNLGVAENLEYNRNEAQKYFYRALELGDKFYEGQYLEFGKINYNLGTVFNEMDALSEAEKHYRTAYDFWETNFGFHPDQTTALLGLGIIASKRGEEGEALRLFQKAEMLDEANFPEKHIRRAATYNQIGDYYSKKGDRATARTYFLKQLRALGMEEVRLSAITQTLPSNLLLAGLTNLGRTHFQDYISTKENSQLDAALRVFAIADTVVSKLRETRLSFNEQNELLRDARALAEWAMLAELAKYGPTSEQIFNRSEQSRALNLYGKFREDAAVRFSGVPDSLVSRHRNLQFEIARYEKLLAETSPADSLHNVWQRRLSDYRLEMSSLKNTLAAHERYYQFRFGTATASVKDVREKILKNNELMLQYFVGDSTLFIFLIGKQRYEVRVIPNDFGIKEKVRDFRLGVTSYYEHSEKDTALFAQSLSAYEINALNLYRRLVAPLNLSPQDSSLIIVPDGDLWLVPFEALLTQAPEMSGDFNSYPYLLQRHDISYAYSATLLREAKSQPYRVAPQKSLWGCAPFDKQYAEMRQASAYRFSELPESAWEVQAAKQTLGGDILIGPQAVKNRFLESLNTYRIVLFSTHAKADEEGYIAFFPSEGSPEKQNLLFTKEVYNLELNAQLVIFSSCQSGLGLLKPGEGMISLARAFTYAGARGLMTTLWEMNDFSGSRINVSVCNHLKSNLPAHRALSSAKREWLTHCSSQEAHPWFWAGTVALGYFGEAGR